MFVEHIHVAYHRTAHGDITTNQDFELQHIFERLKCVCTLMHSYCIIRLITFQLQSISALGPVPNYTAQWSGTCVWTASRVVMWKQVKQTATSNNHRDLWFICL